MEMYYRELWRPFAYCSGQLEGYAAGLLVPRSFTTLYALCVGGILTCGRSNRCCLCWRSCADVSVLWGSRDTVVHILVRPRAARSTGNSATLMIDGVGHLPYEEVPAEFNHIVCDSSAALVLRPVWR